MPYSLTGGANKPPVVSPPPTTGSGGGTSGGGTGSSSGGQVVIQPTYYDILTLSGRIYNVEHYTISGFVNYNYTPPNFYIGSVYTLPNGSASQASLSYSNNNYFLNLALVEGPQGDIGASLTHPDKNDPLSGLFNFIGETAVNVGTDAVLAQMGVATIGTLQTEIQMIGESIISIETEITTIFELLGENKLEVRSLNWSIIQHQRYIDILEDQILKLTARVVVLEQKSTTFDNFNPFAFF